MGGVRSKFQLQDNAIQIEFAPEQEIGFPVEDYSVRSYMLFVRRTNRFSLNFKKGQRVGIVRGITQKTNQFLDYFTLNIEFLGFLFIKVWPKAIIGA